MPITSEVESLSAFGRFEGAVVTQWITPDREMRLVEGFAYIDASGSSWSAPAGSVVDGDSIPRVLWTAIGSPFSGAYLSASVVHDVACAERARPWDEAHRMFYGACRCGGVDEVQAKIMFAAVYHFGPRWGPGSEAVRVAESSAAFQRLQAYVGSANPSLEDIERYAPRARPEAGTTEPPPRVAPVRPRVTGNKSGRSPAEYLRTVGRDRQAGAAESAQTRSGDTARGAQKLSTPEGRGEQLQKLERAFERADKGVSRPDAETQELRGKTLRSAATALEKLGTERESAALEPHERIALEAVIELHDRPSILILNGDLELDPNDPDLSDWQGVLVLAKSRMKKTIPSVGRIDLDGAHIGTGFVVGPGVVMTNRHVLEELAVEQRLGAGPATWAFSGGRPTIDFLHESGSSNSRSFQITGVLFAGPDDIMEKVDVHKLDLALLRVKTTNSEQDTFPGPLRIAKDPAAAAKQCEIYTVGYPARPAQLPLDGSPRDEELTDTLERVFRMRYGVKRLALGRIKLPVGQIPDDLHHWAFGHDATTLGGNSGSCVVVLDDLNNVVGLHFGGLSFEYNFAHVLASVPELRKSPIDAAGLNWG